MALGWLMSLAFQRKRPAGMFLLFAENLNLNQPNTRARWPRFSLAVPHSPRQNPQNAMGGAIRIDSIGFSGKAAPPPFRWHCPNPLTDHSKPTEGRRCFYLAVVETSLQRPKSAPYSLPGRHRNCLAEDAILPFMVQKVAAESTETTMLAEESEAGSSLMIDQHGCALDTVFRPPEKHRAHTYQPGHRGVGMSRTAFVTRQRSHDRRWRTQHRDAIV